MRGPAERCGAARMFTLTPHLAAFDLYLSVLNR